jgi:hypothetical protein
LPQRLSSLIEYSLCVLDGSAPDVYGSPAPLANLLPHPRPDARVAFFGAMTSPRPPKRDGFWPRLGPQTSVFLSRKGSSRGLTTA